MRSFCNFVTDKEKVTKSVTKLNDTLNDIIEFCSTPRSMTEIMEHSRSQKYKRSLT